MAGHRLLAAALSVALLAGCGGSDEPERKAQPPPKPPPAKPSIPTEGSGPPPPGSERVIRAWLAAIREARFVKAASYFAIPVRVQNGGPPQTLKDPAMILAWNATLPCGAVLTNISGAPGGFAIADFELTDRKGSKCGSGLGAPAHSAILVRDGRIEAWYRLADPPAEPGIEA
jgi:hypothetical protein